MSRASRRVQKYLKHRSSDNSILSTYFPKNNKAETLTVQDLQRVLDEHAIARQTVADFGEQITELQEKLDSIGTDEAVAQMRKRAREAADAWREVPLEYHANPSMSLAEVIDLMREQIAGATGKANSEHARADRLEAQLGNAQEEILRQRANDGCGQISEARSYQKRVHPTETATAHQLTAAVTALVWSRPELYPFGGQSFAGILRRGRSNQLAHAGACIAALLDRLPQERPTSMRRVLPDPLSTEF